MDSQVPDNEAPRPLRRSTRKSVLIVEPTPRGPLKRTRKVSDKHTPATAVNGSRDADTDSENDESPTKKRRSEKEGAVGDHGDEIEMEDEESAADLEKDEDQEIDNGEDTPQIIHKPTIYPDPLGDQRLSPVVRLERYQSRRPVNVDVVKKDKVELSTKVHDTKPAAIIRPRTNRQQPIPKNIAEEYHKILSATPKSVNHYVQGGYQPLAKPNTTRHCANNIPKQKEIQHRKQKIKRTDGHSSARFLWYFCCLVLLLLLAFAVLFVYKRVLVHQRTAEHLSRPVKPELLADQLSLLETQFPSQRPELWKRSKIHLQKHLETTQPTEPVSLMLTAGRLAERTMRCLAQRLASSFSSALNASVLHIDGASKAGQDSDQVKLDLDLQLQAAFEGDKPVAVIERFEELPPGSTLIFYRYCDHENAAYKRVFLLFTVLLPQDEISVGQSLTKVEETVQDYVRGRLVDPNSQAAFNVMDKDKFSGLWSRISHLILPVVSERDVEQKGC